MLFYFKSSLYLAFNDFAFVKHSFYRKRRLLQRVPYLFIFVIRENEILIAVIRDSLFFLFVNRATLINHLLISRSNLQASETEPRSKGVLFTNISHKYFSDSISSFIV